MTSQNHYSETESGYLQSPGNLTHAIDIAHSVSVNTVQTLQNEYLLNEALQGGYKFQGRMSNVRRFFCLFVTFDVLFIGLMWLICIMLHGDGIWHAIDQQIKHYNIKTSLFDVFLLAICRFVLLWLFYGIICINHWIIILLTTSSTCAFSIVKVFYYDWQQTPQPVFEVLSILVSFIIAWGEAWFLDYRVIPLETYANEFFNPTIDERSPLIRHYLRGATPSVYTESVENYQSPMQSPEGSLYRSENNSGAGRYPPADLSREEMDKYEALCCKIMEESKELLRCDKWTLERTLNQDESAHSMVLPSGHRIFKIYAIFNTSPKNMLHVLYDDIEVLSKWNSALVEAHRVQEIDEDADIIYQVSASGAGGLVSSRDFVSIRKWTQIGDSYLIATRGTDHPNVPKNSKYVRGENGVTCLYIEPWNDDKCRLEFILNTHLRGWIPQAIVDLAIVDTLVDYTKSLKVHIDKKYPQNNDDIQ